MRRICELCSINYSIIAGTLLGAVRHGGFIPWDDDADVGLLRDDYERFCKACETQLDSERFYFQDSSHTDGYRWGYGKLRRKNSSYIVCGTENMPYEQGIWIDIFPLDNVPDNRLGRAFCNLHCFLIRKFLYSEAGRDRETNKFLRAVYSAMATVQLEKVLAHYNRYVKKRNSKPSRWVRILMFPTPPNKQFGYLRKWYENVKDITFEGESFAGISDTDGYLRFKFGNYLELPPPEKRKQHKVSKIGFPDE